MADSKLKDLTDIAGASPAGVQTTDLFYLYRAGLGTTDYKGDGDTLLTFLSDNLDLSGYVPTTRTVNGHALSSNVTVSLSDIGGAASGANTDITSLLLNQTGLVVKGADSHALTIKPNETMTAARTLNIVTGDASRTLTFTGDASISGTNTGDQTTVSGNAGTATALQTARAINGTSFNGTADITVTAAAGTLTGSALASGVTGSSLTSFGNSPSLTTPSLGAATATSINKMAITAPATISTLAVANGKTATISNTLTFTGTDGSTLNVGGGGTLGTAAYTATSAYEVPLTFSTGLTRSTNTITVNTSQNIATLSNLTSNGFVKTGSGTGALSVDTTAYTPMTTTVNGHALSSNVTVSLTDLGAAPAALTINAQTGTTYTLALSDGLGASGAGGAVTLSNAGAITLTVPTNASMAFPIGTQIVVYQIGAGQVTISAAGGVTLHTSAATLKFRAQYSAVSLLKIGTDTWLIAGDLAAS